MNSTLHIFIFWKRWLWVKRKCQLWGRWGGGAGRKRRKVEKGTESYLWKKLKSPSMCIIFSLAREKGKTLTTEKNWHTSNQKHFLNKQKKLDIKNKYTYSLMYFPLVPINLIRGWHFKKYIVRIYQFNRTINKNFAAQRFSSGLQHE